MEKNRRSVAEEAAAKTHEAMERARAGKLRPFEQPELEDREAQMALPEHIQGKSFMKEHPLEAALGAISAGVLLTRFLPLRGMIGGLLKMAWIIAKPLALIYAGVKLAKSAKKLP